MTYKLCYVSECAHKAWFTLLPLEDQYGDDWSDAPWQCNASRPYVRRDISPKDQENQLFILFFDSPLDVPGMWSHHYSVDDINRKQVPWLSEDLSWTDEPGPPVMIWAGTSIPEFCTLVKKAGGTVYVAYQDYDRLTKMIKDEVAL